MVSSYLNALRRLWKGRCTVYVLKQETNEDNGRTEPKEAALLRDEPCRLSYKSTVAAGLGDDTATVTQEIKLFIEKSTVIPPGSKVTVTQNGTETDYEQSGKPAIYSTHQEITLALFGGWA